MIRIDSSVPAAKVTEPIPQVDPSTLMNNTNLPKDQSNCKARILVQKMILILVAVFCLVTCLILWKDGKVLGQKLESGNSVGTSQEYHVVENTTAYDFIQKMQKKIDTLEAGIQNAYATTYCRGR
jgi:hypothetical protein